MEKKILTNGLEIPVLGYGVYQIRGGSDECVRCIREAIETGYRLIDTAFVYGNEKEVGLGIKESGVNRSEIFLQTKVWTSDMGYEDTKKAIDRSLLNLGVDYIDMYLMHEPMGDIYGTWRAMEEAYSEGKLKGIGVCNMWPDRLLDLVLNVDIKPMLTQIETHPFQQQWTIAPLLANYRIQHQSWAPFAEGRENIWTNKILTPIAEAHGKSVGQVILRWQYQRGIVSLSKTVHKERMAENMDIFDFSLTDAEMEKIKLLDHARPLILNNRDLEVVERISPRLMKQAMEELAKQHE